VEKGMSGFQGKPISSIAAIVGIASIVSNLAVAQSQTLPPATIADNDSIYIDGKTFAITPGRAKGDTSAQVEALGARDLGPGAIIFRSGEKLYIVAAPLKTRDQTASRPNMSYPKAPSFRSSTACYGSTVSSRTCRGY
jgi:hypothetical protein